MTHSYVSDVENFVLHWCSTKYYFYSPLSLLPSHFSSFTSCILYFSFFVLFTQPIPKCFINHMHFGRDLDLTPYTMGGQGSGPRAIYDLYGVVNHKGGILGGHYTSMARCADLVQPLKNEVGELSECMTCLWHSCNCKGYAKYFILFQKSSRG